MNSSRLYVGNIPYSTTSDQLQNLFAGFGTVKEVKIIEGKGFAFVEMSDPTEAENARNELNNKDFNGRSLKIDEARAPKPRRDFDR
ncbi:MAG: RNA-binding protein [Candidatus Wallbacteria bacterium]|nr:RNA-binding protein [Candidatus Wallbacteria bacterium]